MSAEVTDVIRTKSLNRIADTLKIPVSSLSGELLIQDLYKPPAVTGFGRNGFDVLLDDINDVSDSKMLRKIRDGLVSINTVQDYVEHMIACYSRSPRMVSSVLGRIE